MAKKTIAQFRTDLKQITVELKRDLVEPVRIEAGIVAKEVRRDIKSTSLGRALWKRRRNRSNNKSGTPSLSIKKKRTRISATEGGVIGGVDIAGMAAMIVLGGRTAAHTIQPKSGNLLSLGPNQVVTGKVLHPGSAISPNSNIVNSAMDRAAGRLEVRLDKLIESTARRALR